MMTLLGFGFDAPAGKAYFYVAPNKETIAPGHAMGCHPENLGILTKKYNEYVGIKDAKAEQKIEFYAKFQDTGSSRYRRYFYVNPQGEAIAPGRWESVPQGDATRDIDADQVRSQAAGAE